MINMPIESAQLPREPEPAIRWDVPRTLAEAGQTMNGRDFLAARFHSSKDDPLIG
jgi:hypothetical protein